MKRSRRGRTDLSGILIVDKPSGITSHDVVSAVRRATGERRVGHAGTLDPAATGVLVVLVGPATRLAPLLTAAVKSYDARIVFGTRTDTDDAEGAVVEKASVPAAFTNTDYATAVVAGLVGIGEQTPPAYSAIKRDGRVSHRVARAGGSVELEPRTFEIFDASLSGIESGPPVVWNVRMTVSKGTYIRAIARDLGASVGSAAHLGALRRTESGAATLNDAHTLGAVRAATDPGELFADPVHLLGLPVVDVDEAAARRVADGVPLTAPALSDEHPGPGLRAIVHHGALLAVYRTEATGGTLTADVVLPGGIRR